MLGTSRQDGHDHGWQFGFYQLRGANGIVLDLLREREKEGIESLYTVDQRALDYLDTFRFTPDNLSYVQPFLGRAGLNKATYESEILAGLPDRDPHQERLLRDALRVSAFIEQQSHLVFDDAAALYLRSQNTPQEQIDAVVDISRGKPVSEGELRQQLATRLPGLTNSVDHLIDAGSFVADLQSTNNVAVFGLQAWNMITTNDVSDPVLSAAADLFSEAERPVQEFERLVDEAMPGQPEAEKRFVVNAARIGGAGRVPGEPRFDPTWPPEMEPDAIFFGGTDPGRFVPTYMIYCVKCREDVKLITQNALADHTYMNIMRDLYGDQIWMPSTIDSNRAFQEFNEKRLSGEIQSRGDVSFQSSRMKVQGVQDVMQINAILCKQMHDRNKDQHAFYIEESYVMPWMYPYMEAAWADT